MNETVEGEVIDSVDKKKTNVKKRVFQAVTVSIIAIGAVLVARDIIDGRSESNEKADNTNKSSPPEN